MRLKQIKLIGFKSFVDPTVLHLNSQLIGIVGPNGCGKSNIIDAVKWVLGESSAKDLRGESMTDVIFNGSSSRKPIGQAAIELLFDNCDGKLNREYANFSEVSIRREIDRNRQSEYYLNDHRCRKRDITDLFAGTGLLQNGYAIIGQGTVSRIIESKPEDLRNFIEEAAEISIYKKRRHETELRIQHTEENLARLQDLIAEQIRLLEKLEKQQVAARKYQQYQTEKQDLEIKLLSIKVHQFKEELRKYEQEINQISLELEKYLLEKTNIGVRLEQHKINQTEKFDQFMAIQEEYYTLGTNIAKLEQQLQHKKEQHKKNQEDLVSVNLELEKISGQHNEDIGLQQQLTQELLLVNQKYIELEQIKNNSGQELAKAQTNLQDWHTKFNSLQRLLLETQNKAEKTKFSIEQIEVFYKELYSRIEKLNQEHTSYDLNSLATEVLLLEKDLRHKKSLQEEKLQELLQITETYKQKKILIKEILEQKNELQTKIHKLLGTIGAVQALQNASLENSFARSTWLERNSLTGPLFFNQLDIEDGWEVAVGAVLSQYLDAMLLSNINDIPLEALEAIKDFKLVLIDDSNLASRNNQSVSLKNVNNHNGYISISTKINGNFAISDLFKNVYVAQDLTFALENRKNLSSEHFFVTKAGELVGFNWLFIDQSDPKLKVLLRNKELKQLELEQQDLSLELSKLNEQLELEEKDLAKIEEQQATIAAVNQTEEKEVRDLIANISTKKSKLDSIKQRFEKIAIEVKEYQDKLQELSVKETNLRSALNLTIEEVSEKTNQKQLLLEEKPELQRILDQTSKSNKSIIDEFHNVSLQKQGIATKVHALEAAKERIVHQLTTLKERQVKLQQELATNKSPLQPLELELEALLEVKLIKEKELNKSRTELDEVEETIKQLEQQNANLNVTVDQYRAKAEQLNLDQNRVATKLAIIMENSSAQPFSAENLNMEELDPSILQSRLDAISKGIERLGAVNLAAVEEFNLERERKKYLDLQQEDLNTALTTLKEAIFKIDNETRKKFKTTFEQVNTNFQQLFPKLFGGGSARLELESEDWLSSGISVLAQPPGKKNSSIYLLSGGEKALTAVSLIFAIFQLNPSPFCILDEVDAPLDDANVGRFSELLVSMSPQVQFIFISHNKVTMKIANQLIGVTMREPGVSRLVSVNVDEAVEMVS